MEGSAFGTCASHALWQDRGCEGTVLVRVVKCAQCPCCNGRRLPSLPPGQPATLSRRLRWVLPLRLPIREFSRSLGFKHSEPTAAIFTVSHSQLRCRSQELLLMADSGTEL